MKRITLFLILSFACGIANAQTQQGIVKTPTRRNVDGTWTQGQYLSNATISIRLTKNDAEQHYVSGNQGIFSFPAPSPFFVTSVVANKGTYTFIDADFSKKEQRYSTNAVEIVVDDPDLLSKVREEAEAHERKKIKEQIRAKEDEIEELKAANKLTTAEYNQMLEQLSEYRKSSEAIVKQIAEVYVTTDFDKMDEFNRQLLAFVEDGDFARADSLLKTKGSKKDEFERIKNEEAAIQKTKEELQQAEEYHEKDKKSFSDRLYSEHLMHLQRPLMQDSALYCLKMRADLDTTNMDAVFEYAFLCSKQNMFAECEKYYLICLSSYRLHNDIPSVATIQNNLGALYSALHDYASSERYYKLALENKERLFQQNPDAYRAYLAMTQNNLGALYNDLHDYANSERYYKLALENYEQLFMQNPDAYRANLAGTQNNLGNLYNALHDYANSERYCKLALENRERLFQQNPDAYRADLAGTQNNLGILYRALHDYANSERYYKLTLENYEQLFKQNPDAYRANLATTQYNLGILYSALHDYVSSERYYKLALENRERLFQQNPDAYRADLAMIYWNMMLLYADMGNLEQYVKHLEKSMELYSVLYAANPELYASWIIELQNRKIWRLLIKGSIDDALSMAQSTYAMDESHELSKSYLAECYNSKAYEYANESDFANAYISIDEAISLLPNNANFYDSKGEILLMQGNSEEALEMWKKVLELNPDFLNNYPDGTNLSNGLKELGLIE